MEKDHRKKKKEKMKMKKGLDWLDWALLVVITLLVFTLAFSKIAEESIKSSSLNTLPQKKAYTIATCEDVNNAYKKCADFLYIEDKEYLEIRQITDWVYIRK